MEKKHYVVQWTIDIWEDSPQKAALKASEIMQDPSSIATVFHIKKYNDDTIVKIDLSNE